MAVVIAMDVAVIAAAVFFILFSFVEVATAVVAVIVAPDVVVAQETRETHMARKRVQLHAPLHRGTPAQS